MSAVDSPETSPDAPRAASLSSTPAAIDARAAGWFTTTRGLLMGLFGFLFAIAISPAVDPDLPWHLATGRWIVENGRVPMTDPFSWSANGRKWIAHEWLQEIVMYAGWRLGGWTLIIIAAAMMITTAWFALFRTMQSIGARFVPSVATTFLAAIASVHTWGVRPQMLSLLCVAFVGLRLQQWRRAHNHRVPWELVPLTALWANMHGGYIFGITMVLVFACGALGEQVLSRWSWVRGGRVVPTWSRVGRIWALLVGCVAASLATPNTIDGLIYPFTYLGDNASTRYVGEWFAPDFTRVQYWPFALFGIWLIGLMLAGRRHVSLTDVGLTLPFLAMGFQSARNISQATVCGAPLVALLWTRLTEQAAAERSAKKARRSARRNDATPAQKGRIAVGVAGFCVASLSFVTSADLTAAANDKAHAKVQPVIATRWLQEHPGGNLLNHYNYGGWLILKGIPVFIDGRPDMYGDEFVDRYVLLTGLKTDTDADLVKLGVDRVLLPHENELAKHLAKDPNWTQPIDDPVAALFIRTTPL